MSQLPSCHTETRHLLQALPNYQPGAAFLPVTIFFLVGNLLCSCLWAPHDEKLARQALVHESALGLMLSHLQAPTPHPSHTTRAIPTMATGELVHSSSHVSAPYSVW